MTNVDAPRPVVAENRAALRDVQWSAAIVGAIVAAAVAFVLHSFAIAIGLGVSSTAPTWRDASVGLILLSALYLFLVAFVSYGVGGYLAGRMRARLSGAATDEVEYRDGVHGIAAWAIATLLAGLLALGAAQAATRLVSPSGEGGAATSVAGENIIAFDLDRLFRSERPPVGDMSYARAEAARILLTTASHRGLQDDDRAALVRLVSARTGLAPAEAERRVNDVASRAREDINRARRSVVLIAFAAGVAALLGAAVAWVAACAGGRDRDGLLTPRTALSEWWHRPFSLRT